MSRIDSNTLDVVMPPETTESLKMRIKQLQVETERLRQQNQEMDARLGLAQVDYQAACDVIKALVKFAL